MQMKQAVIWDESCGCREVMHRPANFPLVTHLTLRWPCDTGGPKNWFTLVRYRNRRWPLASHVFLGSCKLFHAKDPHWYGFHCLQSERWIHLIKTAVDNTIPQSWFILQIGKYLHAEKDCKDTSHVNKVNVNLPHLRSFYCECNRQENSNLQQQVGINQVHFSI